MTSREKLLFRRILLGSKLIGFLLPISFAGQRCMREMKTNQGRRSARLYSKSLSRFHNTKEDPIQIDSVEDPNSEDVSLEDTDDEDNVSDQYPLMYNRCSANQLVKAVKKMSQKQKNYITSIGFGGILSLQLEGIPQRLGYYVADNFDPEALEIRLPGGTIQVDQEAIWRLLGIPKSGPDFDDIPTHDPLHPKVQLWRDLYSKFKYIPPAMIVSRIQQKKQDTSFNFLLDFLMLFGATMVECHSNGKCKVNILEYLTDESDVSNMNWCGFVLSRIQLCIRNWGKTSTTALRGGLTILTVDFTELSRVLLEICVKKQHIEEQISKLTEKRVGKDRFEVLKKLFYDTFNKMPQEARINCSQQPSPGDLDPRPVIYSKTSGKNDSADYLEDRSEQLTKAVHASALCTDAVHNSAVISLTEHASDSSLRSGAPSFSLGLTQEFDVHCDSVTTLVPNTNNVTGKLEDGFIHSADKQTTINNYQSRNPSTIQEPESADVGKQLINTKKCTQRPSFSLDFTQQKPSRSNAYPYACTQEIPSFSLGLTQIEAAYASLSSDTNEDTDSYGHEELQVAHSPVWDKTPGKKPLLEDGESGSSKHNADSSKIKEVSRTKLLPSPQFNWYSFPDVIISEVFTPLDNAIWDYIFVNHIVHSNWVPTSKGKYEDKKVRCRIVADDIQLYDSGMGIVADLEDLRTMLPGVDVSSGILDCWSTVLNLEENNWSNGESCRLFFGSNVFPDWLLKPTKQMEQVRLSAFTNSVILTMGFGSRMEDFSRYRMAIFPVLEKDHCYVMAFDLEAGHIVLVDNMHIDESTVSLVDSVEYSLKSMPFKIKDLVVGYLTKIGHKITLKVENAPIRRLNIWWARKGNKTDSVLLAMRHMEMYCGEEDISWDVGFKWSQADLMEQMCTLRKRYALRIILSEANTLRDDVIAGVSKWQESGGKPNAVVHIREDSNKLP